MEELLMRPDDELALAVMELARDSALLQAQALERCLQQLKAATRPVVAANDDAPPGPDTQGLGAGDQ